MKNRFFFRVWDTRKGQYVPKEDVCHAEIGLLARATMFIVEQCTGLKDKNGTLIYEGDIIKRHSKNSEEEKDVILQVEWNCKGGRYITTDKTHETWTFSMFDYSYEVVGNIHENPELLEK